MTEFYPGSNKKKKTYDTKEPVPEEKEPLELGTGRQYLVKGQPAQLYPLGALAKALNRQPVTIRKWEQEGVIPTAPLMLPSHDQRGQRRLYTLEHITGLRKIAEEEGLLFPNGNGKWKTVETTNFREKALQLFKGLQ